MKSKKETEIKLKGRKAMCDAKVIERAINNKTTKSRWDNIHELRRRATDEIFNCSLNLLKSLIFNFSIIIISKLFKSNVSSSWYITNR